MMATFLEPHYTPRFSELAAMCKDLLHETITEGLVSLFMSFTTTPDCPLTHHNADEYVDDHFFDAWFNPEFSPNTFLRLDFTYTNVRAATKFSCEWSLLKAEVYAEIFPRFFVSPTTVTD